jgi:hypothetical protein
MFVELIFAGLNELTVNVPKLPTAPETVVEPVMSTVACNEPECW